MSQYNKKKLMCRCSKCRIKNKNLVIVDSECEDEKYSSCEDLYKLKPKCKCRKCALKTMIGSINIECPKGENGADGKDGTNGINGTNGLNGTNGINGNDGKDGKDGVSSVNLIPFSSGTLINGSLLTIGVPMLLGFGTHTILITNNPNELGGFTIPIPYAGTIQNMQVSVDLQTLIIDLLPEALAPINEFGIQYDFTLIRAPSTPNDGKDHPASSYSDILTTSVQFGYPNTTNLVDGQFRTATALNIGSVAVAAGDRIGIRVSVPNSTNILVIANILQLCLSASLNYVPTP
jgi:hypothetical protein